MAIRLPKSLIWCQEQNIGCCVRECTCCRSFKPLKRFMRYYDAECDVYRIRYFCLDCQSRKLKARRAADPEATRAATRKYQRKYKYGITPEEFDRLVIKQAALCAICKEQKELVVDHDHTTGKVRGLLCASCNWALGQVNDNLKSLEGAIRYLKCHQGMLTFCKGMERRGLKREDYIPP